MWLSWEAEGYRYHKNKPKVMLAFYYGTKQRGLIWSKGWWWFENQGK